MRSERMLNSCEDFMFRSDLNEQKNVWFALRLTLHGSHVNVWPDSLSCLVSVG